MFNQVNLISNCFILFNLLNSNLFYFLFNLYYFVNYDYFNLVKQTEYFSEQFHLNFYHIFEEFLQSLCFINFDVQFNFMYIKIKNKTQLLFIYYFTILWSMTFVNYQRMTFRLTILLYYFHFNTIRLILCFLTFIVLLIIVCFSLCKTKLFFFYQISFL